MLTFLGTILQPLASRCRRPVIRFANIAAVLIFLCTGQHQNAFAQADLSKSPAPVDKPKQNTPRNNTERAENVVQVTGKVIDGQGQPVGGVQVQFFDWSKYTGYTPTVAGDTTVTDTQGNFRLIHTPKSARIFEAWFVARDVVGDRQGVVMCNPDAMSEKFSPQIILKPMQVVTVKVVDQHGTPVANAHVEVADRSVTSTMLGKARGETLAQQSAADGTAKLRLPADAWHNPIVAFKSGVGLDYFFIPEPTQGKKHEPWPEVIRLKLAGARTVHMKAVDQAMRPLAGVVFSVATLVVPGKILRVGDYGETYGVDLTGCQGVEAETDAAGVATFDWLPEDFVDHIRFNLVSKNYNPWHQPGFRPRLPDLMQAKPDEELTVTLVRRSKISGQVIFPDDRTADDIDVEAQGVGRDGDSARAGTRTKPDGSYEMFVESDRSYMVCVIDAHWAAPSRDHLIAQGSAIANVDFRLAKGTILHGTVTDGPERRPLAECPVNIQQTAKRSAGEDQKLRDSDGFMFPAFYRQVNTDAAGKYQLCVGPGLYKVGLPALPDTNVLVESQAEIVHDIRLPSNAIKPLAGKVLDRNGQPMGGVEITGIYSRYSYPFDARATTGADGGFEIQREPLPLMFVAKTPDGKLGAMWPVEGHQTKITIRLRSLTQAHGRLVDAEGRPVTVGKLEYGFAVDGGAGRYKLLSAAETAPDGDGHYSLEGLLPGAQCIVNYWLNAGIKLDRQRELTMPQFSARNDHIQLLVFQPKQAEITDLGDTTISHSETPNRRAGRTKEHP